MFQKKVKKHLEQHGLDTIAYLPDPADATKLVNVTDNQALFNLETGCAKADEISTKHFDECAKANQEDASDYVVNCLEALC